MRLKFTLASRFMRKTYKRMLKVHFEIKLKYLSIYFLRPGSCTSELQLKVNCRLKVNFRIKFGLARPKVGRPTQIFSYNSLSVCNSLSAAIHLYMIWPLVPSLDFFRSFGNPFSLQIFSDFDALPNNFLD